MELADSTMFLIGEKGSNSYSAVQNGTKNGSISWQAIARFLKERFMTSAVTEPLEAVSY